MRDITNIILISGKAGHGKTTFGDMLCGTINEYLKEEKYFRIAFGDLVKYICSKYFGYSGTKDEEGRNILQHIATEVVRAHDPTFWADFVARFLDCVKMMEYKWIIIDDFRFPNEAEALYNLDDRLDNIITVKIERYDGDNEYVNPLMTKDQLKHTSETALDNWAFDYIVENHNMEDLKASAEELIRRIRFRHLLNLML
jgi:hypothetical protein